MKNIIWHDYHIQTEDREKLLNQKSCLIWFTGLSGSGKSTIASAVQQSLYNSGNCCYVLDGDNIRHGINSDLGFSESDRIENIRRIREIGYLFVDSGLITLAAFISPHQKAREEIRKQLSDKFIEVYVRCPLDICEKRDPKGLYKKARKKEIAQFTGISSPYEAPENPEIILDSSRLNVQQSCDIVIDYLKQKTIIN